MQLVNLTKLSKNLLLLTILLFSILLFNNCTINNVENTNPITTPITKVCPDSSFMGFECGEISENWKIYPGIDAGESWKIKESDLYSNTGNFCVTASQNEAMLISAQRTIINGDILEFYLRGHRSYSLGQYRVLLSTTGTSLSDFMVIKDTTTSDNEIEKISIDLSSYAGEDVYIVWQVVSYNVSMLYLDDITITNGGSSSAFGLANISFSIDKTDTSLTLDWDSPVGGALAYSIYSSIGDDVTTTSSKASILGDTSTIKFYANYRGESSRTLLLDTTHSFYIKSTASAGNEYSDTITINFSLTTDTIIDTTSDTTLTFKVLGVICTNQISIDYLDTTPYIRVAFDTSFIDSVTWYTVRAIQGTTVIDSHNVSVGSVRSDDDKWHGYLSTGLSFGDSYSITVQAYLGYGNWGEISDSVLVLIPSTGNSSSADTIITYPRTSTYNTYIPTRGTYTIEVELPANQLIKVGGKGDYKTVVLISPSGDTIRDNTSSSYTSSLYEIGEAGKYTFVYKNSDYEKTQLQFNAIKLGDITGNESKFAATVLTDSFGVVLDTIPGSGVYSFGYSGYYILKNVSIGDSLNITKEINSNFSSAEFSFYNMNNDLIRLNSFILRDNGRTIPININGDLLIKVNASSNESIVHFSYSLNGADTTIADTTTTDTTKTFIEGFEGDISDWVTFDEDSDGYTWFIADSLNHTGDKSARIRFGTGRNDDWLITKSITIQSNDSLIFWGRSYLSSFLESYNVLISTTDRESTSSFSINLLEIIDEPNTWTRHAIDLSSYNGQNVFIAWQCISDDQFYLSIDDISIE